MCNIKLFKGDTQGLSKVKLIVEVTEKACPQHEKTGTEIKAIMDKKPTTKEEAKKLKRQLMRKYNGKIKKHMSNYKNKYANF